MAAGNRLGVILVLGMAQTLAWASRITGVAWIAATVRRRVTG